MVDPTRWFKSATPRAPAPGVDAASAASASDERHFPSLSVVVPIRSIGPGQRERILAHLLSLEPHDRYLRFGYAANDEQITRYVDQLNFERDELFGIFNRRLDLIAMAHLAFSIDPQYTSCAEFGVSVAKSARGRGYGSRLFERAVMHARNDFDSRITELVNQQVAFTDYHLKVQAKQFWRLLNVLQDIRQGVREARERARG
jgi:GNAT superfamily N-acetyltransferase